MSLFNFIEYAAKSVKEAYKSMQIASETTLAYSVEDWASKYKTLHPDSHITKKDAVNLISNTFEKQEAK